MEKKEFKLVGPDGRLIPPPRPGRPLPTMMQTGPIIVAQIEQFGNGQFGIRRVSNIASLDLVKVLCNLAASIVQVEQNKMSAALAVPEKEIPPAGIEETSPTPETEPEPAPEPEPQAPGGGDGLDKS